MPRVQGTTAVLGAVAVLVTALLVLAPTSAQAAVTYTWNGGWDASGNQIPGADNTSWDDAANWTPQGVPGDGDSVILQSLTYNSTVHMPSGITLGGLTMSEDGTTTIHLDPVEGAALDLTVGDLDWTGGDINGSMTLTGEGTIGSSQSRNRKTIDGDLVVADGGTLVLDDIGTGDPNALLVTMGHVFEVQKGAGLEVRGPNLVEGVACCVHSAVLRNNGHLRLRHRATLRLANVPYRQSSRGDTQLSRGSVLATDSSLGFGGGEVGGTGQLRGKVSNSRATISPGGSKVGTLTVHGSYRQGKRGVLSLTTGRHTDRLVVTGRARLGGRLSAHGRLPRHTTATILRAGRVRSTFTHVKASHARVRYTHSAVKLRRR